MFNLFPELKFSTDDFENLYKWSITVPQERHNRDPHIQENEDSTVIEVATPGVKKEDLTVEVQGRSVVLSLSKKASSIAKMWSGKLQFSWRFGERSDLTKITVGLCDGILTITVPKNKETTKTHEVTWL